MAKKSKHFTALYTNHNTLEIRHQWGKKLVDYVELYSLTLQTGHALCPAGEGESPPAGDPAEALQPSQGAEAVHDAVLLVGLGRGLQAAPHRHVLVRAARREAD